MYFLLFSSSQVLQHFDSELNTSSRFNDNGLPQMPRGAQTPQRRGVKRRRNVRNPETVSNGEYACPVLSCPVLSCPVSSRLVSSRLVSSRLVSSRHVWSGLVWSGLVWSGLCIFHRYGWEILEICAIIYHHGTQILLILVSKITDLLDAYVPCIYCNVGVKIRKQKPQGALY